MQHPKFFKRNLEVTNFDAKQSVENFYKTIIPEIKASIKISYPFIFGKDFDVVFDAFYRIFENYLELNDALFSQVIFQINKESQDKLKISFYYDPSILNDKKSEKICFFSVEVTFPNNENCLRLITRYATHYEFTKFFKSGFLEDDDVACLTTIGLSYLKTILPFSSTYIKGNFLEGDERQFTLITTQTSHEVYINMKFFKWYADTLKRLSMELDSD